MKVGDLVALQWVDSMGCPRGWVRIDEIDSPEIATVQSVGWVMEISKKKIVLAPHLAFQTEGDEIDNASAQGMMAIPCCCIVKKSVLTSSVSF